MAQKRYLFVDATPESELAEKCRKEFRKPELKVKLVDRPGRSVKRTLVKSNPFKKLDATAAQNNSALGGEVDCKSREVLYKI